MDFPHYIGILLLLGLAGVSHAVWTSDPLLQIAQDPGRQYSCYVQLPNGQVKDLSHWCGAFTPQANPPTAAQPEPTATANTNAVTDTNNSNLPTNSAPSRFVGKPQPNSASPAQSPSQGTNTPQDTQNTTDDASKDQ